MTYDPALLDETVPLPELLMGDARWWHHRSASPWEAAHKLGARPRRATVKAYYSEVGIKLGLNSFRIPLRRATPHELAGVGRQDFSACTLPLVVSVRFGHNLCEYLVRALPLFAMAVGLETSKVTPVLFSPDKLALATFARELLRPFTRYEPASFAAFSAPRPPDTPSNSTYEGVVGRRCFRRVHFYRLSSSPESPGTPSFWTTAAYTRRWWSERVRTRPPRPFWSPPVPRGRTMRVLIEARPGVDRQMLGLPALLDACNNEAPPPWQGSRFEHVECRSIVFGTRGFAADVAAVQQADVLLGTHGAGQVRKVPFCSAAACVTPHIGLPISAHPAVPPSPTSRRQTRSSCPTAAPCSRCEVGTRAGTGWPI